MWSLFVAPVSCTLSPKKTLKLRPHVHIVMARSSSVAVSSARKDVLSSQDLGH